MNKLNWESFEPKFGDWSRYMKDFFEGEDAFNIYKRLKNDSFKGAKILPSSNSTFKAFTATPPSSLRLIVIGQDPYPGVYKDGSSQATGLALDCSNSKEQVLQPSLKAFFDGIAQEIECDAYYTNDLRYLASQGVLLLNKSLTVIQGQIGSHTTVWEKFYEYFLGEVITKSFPGVPILFLGKEASYLQKYIYPLTNPIFILDHPSFAARTNTTWDTKGVFTEINQLLELNNGWDFIIMWFENSLNSLIDDLPF
jgi:uracil-DNA glycosylase